MENGQNYECDGFSTFPPGGVRGAIGISAYVMQFDWSNAHCALIKYVDARLRTRAEMSIVYKSR